MIINKDQNNFAKGKLFLDGGIYISEITNKSYIHYEFQLSGQTLHKFNLNRDGIAEGKPAGVASIILADQTLPNDETDPTKYYSKACFVGNDLSFYNLSDPVYD